jgi:hypothetical protein
MRPRSSFAGDPTLFEFGTEPGKTPKTAADRSARAATAGSGISSTTTISVSVAVSLATSDPSSHPIPNDMTTVAAAMLVQTLRIRPDPARMLDTRPILRSPLASSMYRNPESMGQMHEIILESVQQTASP